MLWRCVCEGVRRGIEEEKCACEGVKEGGVCCGEVCV